MSEQSSSFSDVVRWGKGSYRNPRKGKALELPYFSELVHCVVSNGKELYIGKIMKIVG